MNAEAAIAWLGYARENLRTAQWAFQNGLLNPSLQKALQAVEKALKAVWVFRGQTVRKTHSIADLVEDLAAAGADVGSTLAQCHLLDSVYLPSKYPVESVLPERPVDTAAAGQCVGLAEQVCAWAAGKIAGPGRPWRWR